MMNESDDDDALLDAIARGESVVDDDELVKMLHAKHENIGQGIAREPSDRDYEIMYISLQWGHRRRRVVNITAVVIIAALIGFILIAAALAVVF